jgi:hypothetical protein
MSDRVRFSALKLPSTAVFDAYMTGETENCLSGLSVVNLFVGPNNSGKSRFLRQLFLASGLHYTTNKYSARTFRDFASKYRVEFGDILRHGVRKIGKVNSALVESTLVEIPDSLFIEPGSKFPDSIREIIDGMGGPAADVDVGVPVLEEGRKVLRAKVQGKVKRMTEDFLAFRWDSKMSSRERFYVPIRRGMRPLKEGKEDCYRDRTQADYFKKEKPSAHQTIFTGLGLYSTLKKFLLRV